MSLRYPAGSRSRGKRFLGDTRWRLVTGLVRFTPPQGPTAWPGLASVLRRDPSTDAGLRGHGGQSHSPALGRVSLLVTRLCLRLLCLRRWSVLNESNRIGFSRQKGTAAARGAHPREGGRGDPGRSEPGGGQVPCGNPRRAIEHRRPGSAPNDPVGKCSPRDFVRRGASWARHLETSGGRFVRSGQLLSSLTFTMLFCC